MRLVATITTTIKKILPKVLLVIATGISIAGIGVVNYLTFPYPNKGLSIENFKIWGEGSTSHVKYGNKEWSFNFEKGIDFMETKTLRFHTRPSDKQQENLRKDAITISKRLSTLESDIIDFDVDEKNYQLAITMLSYGDSRKLTTFVTTQGDFSIKARTETQPVENNKDGEKVIEGTPQYNTIDLEISNDDIKSIDKIFENQTFRVQALSFPLLRITFKDPKEIAKKITPDIAESIICQLDGNDLGFVININGIRITQAVSQTLPWKVENIDLLPMGNYTLDEELAILRSGRLANKFSSEGESINNKSTNVKTMSILIAIPFFGIILLIIASLFLNRTLTFPMLISSFLGLLLALSITKFIKAPVGTDFAVASLFVLAFAVYSFVIALLKVRAKVKDKIPFITAYRSIWNEYIKPRASLYFGISTLAIASLIFKLPNTVAIGKAIIISSLFSIISTTLMNQFVIFSCKLSRNGKRKKQPKGKN